jgi:hypothetical protein
MPTRAQYGIEQSQQKEIKAPDIINSQNHKKLPPSRNRLSGTGTTPVTAAKIAARPHTCIYKPLSYQLIVFED